MKNRTFVIGDIHGNIRALKQCFCRAEFDYEKDTLISLGDYVDGLPNTKEVIEELLHIENLIPLIGNHDQWALDWYSGKEKRIQPIWYKQGGESTLGSYGGESVRMPKKHLEFLQRCRDYYIDEKNRCFVHGGFDPNIDVKKQERDYLTWDRDLLETAWNKEHNAPRYKFPRYNQIFVGHTTTQWFARNQDKSMLTPRERALLGTEPLFLCNLIALDTGAGWNGKLTIMDVDTLEYWQSDLTTDLYPEYKGR